MDAQRVAPEVNPIFSGRKGSFTAGPFSLVLEHFDGSSGALRAGSSGWTVYLLLGSRCRCCCCPPAFLEFASQTLTITVTLALMAHRNAGVGVAHEM